MPLDMGQNETKVTSASLVDVTLERSCQLRKRGQPGEEDDRVAPRRMVQRNECGVDSGNNSDACTT